MDWEIVAVIAEIAGVIAVVITLAFLAVEVKNGRNGTEAASVDALATGFNALHAQIITDPEFAKIWMLGCADPDSIDDVGRLRLGLEMQSYVNHYAALRRHYESGLFPKDSWVPYASGVAAMLNSPGGLRLSPGFSIPPTIAADMVEYKNRSAEYAWFINAEHEKK
ncbi:MAG: hypothetical protein ACU84Q_09245 [Gammaproteobacteria bacterium]